MDLRHHKDVITRFKWLIFGGFVLAVLLIFVYMVRVQLNPFALSWRQSETWRSTQTMLVTTPNISVAALPSNPADPNAFSLGNLPVFYSQLATSDAVKSLILRSGPINGYYDSYQVVDGSSGSPVPLPFIAIDGYATSQTQAIDFARRVSAALQSYLRSDQVASNTPRSSRVTLDVTNAARKATLVKGRSKSVPIALFLAVMAAAVALAYILENLRPRVELGAVVGTVGHDTAAEAAWRTQSTQMSGPTGQTSSGLRA
jgi:hypothetical protein